MSESASLLTIQLLSWVAARPRSYAELKDAWRSTCPLTCAWEDAFNDGLVALVRGERPATASVILTKRGHAALAASAERRHSPSSPFSLDPARPRL